MACLGVNKMVRGRDSSLILAVFPKANTVYTVVGKVWVLCVC